MATMAVSVQAAFATRNAARSEVKRHAGELFKKVQKVVPLCGGHLVHVSGHGSYA